MSSLMRWPKGHCPLKTPSTACGDGSDSWIAIFMPTAGRKRSGPIFRQLPFAACSSCRRHLQIQCGGKDDAATTLTVGCGVFRPQQRHLPPQLMMSREALGSVEFSQRKRSQLQHVVVTGPPGTGKSTVAEYAAR